jgi:hypothetical protein
LTENFGKVTTWSTAGYLQSSQHRRFEVLFESIEILRVKRTDLIKDKK